LAYDVFDLPARVASNRILGISKSEFITSIGTAKYILSRMTSGSRANDINNQKPDKLKKENSFFKKLTNLFHGLF
jgi:cell division protein FtsA